RIVHCPAMRVLHRAERWTWRLLVENARRYERDVAFLKKHGFFFFKKGPILHPRFLFFPLLLWKYRRHLLTDLPFLPRWLGYVFLLRLHIWRAAWRDRVFV